jgi:hypothetical protein
MDGIIHSQVHRLSSFQVVLDCNKHLRRNPDGKHRFQQSLTKNKQTNCNFTTNSKDTQLELEGINILWEITEMVPIPKIITKMVKYYLKN